MGCPDGYLILVLGVLHATPRNQFLLKATPFFFYMDPRCRLKGCPDHERPVLAWNMFWRLYDAVSLGRFTSWVVQTVTKLHVLCLR